MGWEATQQSPALIVAIVLVVFPLFWVAIVGLIAHAGWRKVADAFPATSDAPLSARRVMMGSLSLVRGPLRAANYGTCINAWITDSGIWLRPILIFRPFHPMIFLPWARIGEVEEAPARFGRRVRIRLGGELPELVMAGSLARGVLEHRRPGARPMR